MARQDTNIHSEVKINPKYRSTFITRVGAQYRRYHSIVWIELSHDRDWTAVCLVHHGAVATTGKPLTSSLSSSSSLSYNVTCLRDNRTRICHGHIIKFHLHSMYYLFTRGNSFKVVVFIFGSFPISATSWYRYRRSAFTHEYYLNSPEMICTLHRLLLYNITVYFIVLNFILYFSFFFFI